MSHPYAKRAMACALGMAALGAAPAQAIEVPLGDTQIAYTAGSESTCQNPAWVTPFTRIGDAGTYVLAPDGAFTDGNPEGWQFVRGARLASDRTRGTGLALPAGSSAISPGMCIDLNYPHMRFAQKTVGEDGEELTVKVEVVYPRVSNPVWTTVDQLGAREGNKVPGNWRISPPVSLRPDLGGLEWGARYVALRFSVASEEGENEESGDYRVDDILVDPRMRS